jgi:hypothetical protein
MSLALSSRATRNTRDPNAHIKAKADRYFNEQLKRLGPLPRAVKKSAPKRNTKEVKP